MGTGPIEENPQNSTPEWLTNEFFEDILRWHFQDDNLQVLEVKTKNLATKGISFSSILHRVTISFRKQNEEEIFQAIIKAHPNGSTGVTARKNKLFQREILVYKEILPKIKELLLYANDYTQISPKCFYTTENPEPILLLEDMKMNNYQMFERNRLLNLEYILPVIQKLAKLHATSAIINQQNPGIMNYFREGPISSNPDRQDFLGFFPANIRSLAIEVSKWSGYEEISEKLFKLEKNILQKAILMFEDDYDTDTTSKFKVLNLGDLWINNLMFHCDDDKIPDDVILIDYQLSYFGSPAIDLNYFLYGSLNENVRKVHYKFIIREYHRYLKETLEKLNYDGDIPTLKDIHIQIIKKSLHGVIAATCLTPLIFMESEKYENLDGLFQACEKGDAFRTANIQNPKYKTFIQKTLKEFELSGYLD